MYIYILYVFFLYSFRKIKQNRPIAFDHTSAGFLLLVDSQLIYVLFLFFPCPCKRRRATILLVAMTKEREKKKGIREGEREEK